MDHPVCVLALGEERRRAIETLARNHYTHSVPSGKAHYLLHGSTIVVFAIPANKNIGPFLLGVPSCVWELSRLWAPDGHSKNALTEAVAAAVAVFKRQERSCVALVSYADPNIGHRGGIYRAASWYSCGQCEEGRYYMDAQGQVVARRKFHSGTRALRKAEIEALGYREVRRPGKHRFAKGLTRWARKQTRERFLNA